MAENKWFNRRRKKKLDAAFDAIDLFNPNIQTTLDKIEAFNEKEKKLKEATNRHRAIP